MMEWPVLHPDVFQSTPLTWALILVMASAVVVTAAVLYRGWPR
jgi:hypothetical protein